MVNLTEQQSAALSRATNLAVTAGAGTGKTLLLVERYLDIVIQDEVDIKSVLAITFTKKAAAEMLERVAGRLNQILDSETGKKQQNKLIKIREQLYSTNISTIHSFCMRILREYPMEAGLDPDFGQLTEYQQNLLLNEAIYDELQVLDDEKEDWLPLFRLYGRSTIETMLRAAMAQRFELKRICDQYEKLKSELLYQKLVERFLQYVTGHFPAKNVHKIIDLVNQIYNSALNGVAEHEKASAALNIMFQFIEVCHKRDLEFWQSLFTLADYFTRSDNQAYQDVRSFGGLALWGEEIAGKILNLSSELVTFARQKLTIPAATDNRIIEHNRAFYQLYKRVLSRYTKRKQELVKVDYDDLQIKVLDLLENNPDLRNRLTQQYRYVMIDEFQDTNMLQWQIISCLGDLISNKYFIVGDPKQSIYGFRNADIRVFETVKQQFYQHHAARGGTSDIMLSESFRFAPRLGDFVNNTFTYILQPSANNSWEVAYNPVVCAGSAETDGIVECAFFNEECQSDFVALKIMELLERFSPGDIAILLRTRNHLSEIENSLRQYNIPFRTIGGIGFYQRQEIFDIYHLIRFLIDPADDNALIALLRSPFVNVSDETIFFLAQAKKETSYWSSLAHVTDSKYINDHDINLLSGFYQNACRWLSRRDRVGFHELLQQIFDESMYCAIMAAQFQGERFLANIEKILEMAIEFEQAGFTSLSDFADSLQDLISKEVRESEAQLELEDELTVKVMTIHQAKGLEFEVVIMPYQEQKLRAGNSICFFDEDLGFAARIIPSEAGTTSYALYDLLRIQQMQKEMAELKRLFYVGCTRARTHLVLSAFVKEDKAPANTPAEWLIKAQGWDLAVLADNTEEHGIKVIRQHTQPEDMQNIKSNYGKNLARLNEIIALKSTEDYIPTQFMTIHDTPRGEIFSATQIMVFEADPDEYFRRYHLGFFEGDYELPAAYTNNEDLGLLVGKLTHKMLEKQQDFDLDRALFMYEISDREVVGQIRTELENLNMIIAQSKVLRPILGAARYQNEISVIAPFGPDYLTGTLDRLFINDSEEWEIVDYKTNQISAALVKPSATKYQTQLDVYAVLLSRLYPGQNEYPVSLYFCYPDVLHRISYKKNDIIRAERRIKSQIARIKFLEPFSQNFDNREPG